MASWFLKWLRARKAISKTMKPFMYRAFYVNPFCISAKLMLRFESKNPFSFLSWLSRGFRETGPRDRNRKESWIKHHSNKLCRLVFLSNESRNIRLAFPQRVPVKRDLYELHVSQELYKMGTALKIRHSRKAKDCFVNIVGVTEHFI